MRRRKEDLHLT